MARRWRDPSAFRADPAAAPGLRPTRMQSLALLLGLIVVAGAVTLASFLIRPDKARAFDLLHGSLFIDDVRGPVAIDLASAKPTVRIGDATATVNALVPTELTVVPLDSGTLLLNTVTGEFNMIDSTGFVVKHDGGVPLPHRTGSTSAVGIASGDDAYIEQIGKSGTSVYLVTPATVTSALSGATVKPRGFISMNDPVRPADGASATAGGSLWLLLGSGNQRTVRQLSLPPNSNVGATLRSADRDTVTGPAALGSASTGAATSGTIGLATPGRIELFTGGTRHTVQFTAPPGVNTILPASDQDTRLSFLMHGTNGWYVVSVNADGSGLRRPAVLPDLPGTATLLEPAQSRDALYTMDRGTGKIYRVDAAGATELASYPLVFEKGNNYTDAYVVARQSRVIVNSPSHRDAMAIFTDGSNTPQQIVKNAGVAVSGAGGAEALAQAHTQRAKPNSTDTPSAPPPTNNVPPPPPPPETNRLACMKTGQQPHIPQNVRDVAGSRSVLLQWDYPILDPDDCRASTYVVAIKLLSSGAPELDESVTVEDHTAVNITELFPASMYSMTVTAKIGDQSASAEPITVTTGKEGPAAPSDVKVVADDSGNWILSWSSCGTIEDKCVPAASWDILPTYCDGLGVEGQPPIGSAPADDTTKRQPTYTYPGGAALLGRGLSFQIEGKGDDQATGEPSASSSCVTSWSPPVRGALTLSASQPPPTTLGEAAATTVSLDLGADATRDVGGLGATITLTLTGPDGPQTKRIIYSGKSARVSATFGGVRAGANYSAGATVSPPGPGGHSVTLSPQPVTTRADWPAALAIDAHCPRIGLGLTCDLTVNITGLSSARAGGERFDLTTDSRLQCGTTTKALSLTDFDPFQTPVTLDNVSQLNQLVGPCTVIIGLVENVASPAPTIFGGTISPTLTTPVDLGSPARSGIGHDDLNVSWGSSGTVQVSYSPGLQDKIDSLTENWTEEVDAPDGTPCGSSTTSQPTDLPVANSCVVQHGGDPGQWTVTIGYQDTSDGKSEGPFTYHLDGPVPGYQQCTPAGFTASWGATVDQGVTTSYLGSDPDVLAGCSKWQYTLLDPTGTSCGTADVGPPATDGTGVQILLTCGTPPSLGWTVEIDYQDTAGDPQTIPVDVGGIPPPS